MLVLDIVLGLAVLALLSCRQLAARPASASALRLIAILGIIGLRRLQLAVPTGPGELGGAG